MDAEAKREWNSIIPELSRMNLLSSADRAALAAYCQAYADLASAVKTLRKTGKTIKTEKGNFVQHPAVGQKNRAMLIMGKFLAEFGLSPSSRTRLSVPETNAEEDAMDAFLRGAG
jgi:P27 family predicted phage terminase small subunit